ncbi:MAG: hypothetical protein LBR33_00985 [Propionibacteriaceae bacterium]|jgi:hypothetical protein|nr:hypothetical protein [Propionibacteriaceae bacterium]
MVGRAAERRLLEDLVASREAELAVVYGRRRVGKTFLVRRVLGERLLFSYTGAANVTAAVQLARVEQALRAHGWNGPAPLTTWFDAFDALRALIERSDPAQPAIVFLDELPWMDNRRSGFLPAFEHFWNGWGSGVARLKLVICGSAASWLTKKVFQNRGGLHNRVTRPIHLAPFTLGECKAYADARGLALNLHDLVESQMVFGGIPYYLRLLDPRRSLALNVDALCFGDNAPLAGEFDQVFSSLFARPERHRDVVALLSKSHQGVTRQDLARGLGFADGGTLTQVLDDLGQSGFVRHYQPYGKAKNGGLWQITDPFVAFHLRFMTRARTPDFWSASTDSAARRAWSGYAFERVCLNHVPQLRRALGIGGVVADVSSWRARPDGDSPGAQVDLVIDRNDQVVNLCEMKYSAGDYAVDAATERTLRNKAEAFRRATKTRKALHLTLVTTYGLKPGLHAGVFQSTVTAADLLA